MVPVFETGRPSFTKHFRLVLVLVFWGGEGQQETRGADVVPRQVVNGSMRKCGAGRTEP